VSLPFSFNIFDETMVLVDPVGSGHKEGLTDDAAETQIEVSLKSVTILLPRHIIHRVNFYVRGQVCKPTLILTVLGSEKEEEADHKTK